ncbi:hypothetical protein [Rugosimonospora africana]|uniref:Uncharacterized protein n=1 Tax=Rugosimonospora africana TaxID=556532 RepID=A0A8J3VUZ5_9ACTN|nr:hypothetical protein [Rugosimonospora africana]GIH19198.1 hypothetical protein Raf01_73700 [Rugosimonospora africana]
MRTARLIRNLAVGYLPILPALAVYFRWGLPPIVATLLPALFVAAIAHVSLQAVRDAEMYRLGFRQVVRSRRTGSYRWSDDGIRPIEHSTREGLMTLALPTQMWQGLPGRVEVGIAAYQPLQEDLADLAGRAADAGPAGSGADDLMRVTLIGDGFAISPRDAWEQSLSPDACWQFDVTPLSPVARVLTLVTECVVAVPGGGRRRIPLPNVRQRIAARADYAFWIRWMLREHGRRIAVVSVAAVAVAVAWTVRG